MVVVRVDRVVDVLARAAAHSYVAWECRRAPVAETGFGALFASSGGLVVRATVGVHQKAPARDADVFCGTQTVARQNTRVGVVGEVARRTAAVATPVVSA